MTFRSKNVSAPVKAVVVSASHCSGKTYTLRQLSSDDYFQEVCIFEMDSLKDSKGKSLKNQLPIARHNFKQWLEDAEGGSSIDELCMNIDSSEPKVQLAKLKYVELMSTSGQFITVLPGSMRHRPDGIRFIELLEEHFQKRIVHIAIIPKPVRYLLNLIYRKRFRLSRLKIALAERASLIAKKPQFDRVIEIPLWTTRKDCSADVFKKYIQESHRDGNRRSDSQMARCGA